MTRVSGGRPVLQAALFLALAPLLAPTQTADLAAESHRARELMAARRFEEAIPIYEKLVQAVPGNAGLLLNLALAEEMAGHEARSVPHFEAVLLAQPDNVPALLSLATARLRLHQAREALVPLQKLMALQPGNRDALGMLAEAELGANRFDDAAGHYRQLAALDGADPRVWFGLGKAYESLATRTFDSLNTAAPQSPYVAALLADTRLGRRQYRSAYFFYRQAQAQLPDLPGVHAGLAQVYRGAGHDDWASVEQKREAAVPAPGCGQQAAECDFLGRRYLRAVQDAAPGAPPSTLFWVIKAYNQLAAEAFGRLDQLPESIQMHAFKAQILRDHDRTLEAAAEWRAAAKLAPGDAMVKRELAAAVFDAKDYRAAVPLLEAELQRAPRAPDLNYMLGTSLWHIEQPEKALPYLESASRAPEAVPAVEGVLGLVLVSLNKNAAAIPHLKKGLALDDDGALHYSLARAYRAVGSNDLAAATIEQYQQIQKRNKEVDQQLAKEAEIAAPAP